MSYCKSSPNNLVHTFYIPRRLCRSNRKSSLIGHKRVDNSVPSVRVCMLCNALYLSHKQKFGRLLYYTCLYKSHPRNCCHSCHIYQFLCHSNCTYNGLTHTYSGNCYPSDHQCISGTARLIYYNMHMFH